MFILGAGVMVAVFILGCLLLLAGRR